MTNDKWINQTGILKAVIKSPCVIKIQFPLGYSSQTSCIWFLQTQPPSPSPTIKCETAFKKTQFTTDTDTFWKIDD